MPTRAPTKLFSAARQEGWRLRFSGNGATRQAQEGKSAGNLKRRRRAEPRAHGHFAMDHQISAAKSAAFLD